MNVTPFLHRLLDRRGLTSEECRQVISALIQGELSPVQMAAFLTALRVKGETIEELTGAAQAMRDAAVRVATDRKPLVDTCGTGGDGRGTFNVSTAAAFVVAGAGFTVAKHGNRAVSSASGSADVLEAMDTPMETDPKRAETFLKDIGLAFLFAPAFHPAMKNVMPIRKELGARTLFNLLGPLCNPAQPTAQLVGVFDPIWLKPIAEVLKRLGCEEAFVVYGQGTDEVALTGPTDVAELHHGQVRLETWRPEDFGYKTQAQPNPVSRTPAESAKVLLEILHGRLGFERSMVCMNAAAAIRAAARTKAGGAKNMTLKEATLLAQKSIDSKAALRVFEKLKAALHPSE